MDYRVLLLTGTDYPIPECSMALHQPTMEEIGIVGESTFFIALQTLIVNKSMLLQVGENVPSDITNFQIFMTIMSQKETLDKRQAVQDLFTIIVPAAKLIFTPQSMLVQHNGNTIIIDENNFDFLQAGLEEMFCLKNSLSSNFNPANAEADRIAKKIMAGRQKIAQEKGSNLGSIFVQYMSILEVALSLSITELKKYTVFQIYDAIERLGLYIEYDIDLRARLAGGKPNKQPENWMKNLY